MHLLLHVLATLLATSEAVYCPPWFISYANTTLSSTTQPYSHCVCSQQLLYGINCSQTSLRSYLRLGNCAFWDNVSNSTMVGGCPYVFPHHNLVDMKLQLPQDVYALNSFLCAENFNRVVNNHSSSCGRCADGRGPSVTTVGSQCVKCSAVNIIYYCLLQYLPATIIFLLILIVQVNVTSAPMAHYVLFCSALVSYFKSGPNSITSYVVHGTTNRYILRAFFMFNSIWSFDPLFFVSPPLCLSPHIQDIDRPYIEMLATLYPFMLLVLAYVGIELHSRDVQLVVLLWRPLHKRLIHCRRSWSPNASLIHAFATVFFISYAKLLFVVFIPFGGVYFANEHGTIRNEPMLILPFLLHIQSISIYLAVFSLCILAFIVMPPIVLLMVYPTRLFTKLRNHLSPRLNLAIDTFVNTYQGCYKDGTNGTRDYRFWSGGFLAVYMLLLIAGLSADAFVEVNNTQPVIQSQSAIVSTIALSVAFAVLRPYKSNIANITLLALVALAATLNMSLVTVRHKVVYAAIIIGVVSIPHCVFYGYVVYRFYKKSNHFKRALRRWCCLKNVPEEEELLI